jgi:cytochrome oxidase Cu insertion factor (SCO1/SenC/PrrC family)
MEQKSNPQRSGPALRSWWVAVVALGAVLALAAGLVTAKFLALRRQAETADIIGVAPGFTLHDQQGRPTSLQQFRGKVVVLTFIDPECTQLCPLTTRSMIGALKLLGPGAASQVQLLGIDANPLKTRVEDVADYTRTHELEGKWRFLTGSRAELEKIWKAYHVYVAVEKNDIEHTAVVFVIDQQGNERNVYSTPMSYAAVGDDAQTLASGIAPLLPGHRSIPAPNPADEAPDAAPGGIQTVSLTTFGPKPQPVILGSSHAHLVVFFAGWLEPGPQLAKNMAVLDSYAAMARQRGWPSPVAVDVLTTEPSEAEAQKELTPLVAALRTPIVQDTTGKIADNYHVDDLPWFVLSSASGKILWTHDGWLSASDLNRQVNAAIRKNSALAKS